MPACKRERSESPTRPGLLPTLDMLRRSATPPMPAHLQHDAHATDRMASILMDKMLHAEDVLGAQLQEQAAAAGAKPAAPAHTASNLFKSLAATHQFIPWEQLLFAACECTFSDTDMDLTRIAQAVKLSRVREDKVALHAHEIGIKGNLRMAMVRNIRAFTHFMYAVEKLDIVKFQDPIEHRSLLGYKSIKIVHQKRWEDVIAFACDQGCFGAKSTIYEMLLRFGYGAVIGARPRKNNKPGNSTDKKNDVLLYTNPLVFNKERLTSNLKRYTNGQTKPKENSLLVLANVAQQSSTSI